MGWDAGAVRTIRSGPAQDADDGAFGRFRAMRRDRGDARSRAAAPERVPAGTDGSDGGSDRSGMMPDDKAENENEGRRARPAAPMDGNDR